MTLAGEIAKYVDSIDYLDLSPETVHSAKRLVADTFGCALGGMRSQPAVIAGKSIPYTNGKKGYSSSVLGSQRKTTPDMAAFVNETMARYLDYNDTYDGKEFAHPSDNIFPVLAVAEAGQKNGRSALLATVLAYELQCRLADAANLWKKGWDQVTYMLVSVSAASSKLMGLTVDQTEQAINIALSSHIVMRQLRVGELSMWKAPAPANSARNAIFSAMLAKNGMTGPAPIFEGQMGFWNQVTGRFSMNVKNFGSHKNRFKINDTLIKYFPAETRAQAAIWCALQVKKEIPGIDQVQSVEIGTNEGGLRIIGSGKEKWDPMTKETADHSLPYITAVALMDGEVGVGSFEKRRFRDKRTLDFMKRITVKERKEFTKLFDAGGTVNADDLIVKLKNGKAIRKKVLYPRGHPKNKMTDREIENKFIGLATGRLNRDKMDLLLHNIWNLDRLNDIGRLFMLSR